jgi:uncharacterized protein (TIGR00299 family) protein
MRVAYLDCFAGISGDMFLGALLESGVPLAVMQSAVDRLKIGASIKIRRVDRSGIVCSKVDVFEDERAADPNSEAEAIAQQSFSRVEPLSQQPKTQHEHKAGHDHTHEHGQASHDDELNAHVHSHGRSLSAIRKIINESGLDESVKRLAIHAFELLGKSEAKIHGVSVEEIHFHEVGAVDAIVDIVASCVGIQFLKVDKWYCSKVNVGSGMVSCAHGLFPVPAPATADLLRNVPTYAAHVEKELVTPTGAALLRVLEPVYGAQPQMRVEAIGYGAGSRNPPGFPNVLRLSLGEADQAETASVSLGAFDASASSTVSVLESAIDDLSPQVLAYAVEMLMAKGALDAMLTPVVMKKGRSGTLLTVLCEPQRSAEFQRLILAETSTLGVRVRQEQRTCLDRTFQTVETPYGEIRMKIGTAEGEAINAAPEFEDCRAAAVASGVALKLVQQAAIAAYVLEAEKGTKAQ